MYPALILTKFLGVVGVAIMFLVAIKTMQPVNWYIAIITAVFLGIICWLLEWLFELLKEERIVN